MEAFVATSNEYLAKGRNIPFLKDHNLSQDSKIGLVSAPFVILQITEELLPDPRMTDLIGKWAVVATFTISDSESIKAYYDKRLKELSIGLWLDAADYGFPGREMIFEVSAVYDGAVDGAALLSKNNPDIIIATFGGLTLSDTAEELHLKERDQLRGASSICGLFMETTEEILTRPESKLQGNTREQLIALAINDLSSWLRSRFGLPPQSQQASKPEPDPTNGKSEPTQNGGAMPVGTTLSALVDAKAKKDSKERSDIVAGLAKAVSLTVPIVNQILSGKIKCPFTNTDNPLERFTAAAQYLGGEAEGQALYDEAMANGCTYPRTKESDEGAGNQNSGSANGDNSTLAATVARLEASVEAQNGRIQTLEAENAQLKQEAAESAHLQATTERYTELRREADRLVASGQMMPAKRDELFGTEVEAKSKIACFAKPPEGQEKTYNLDLIAAKLEAYAESPAKIQTGKIDQDPIDRYAQQGSGMTAEEEQKQTDADYAYVQQHLS